MTHRIHPVTQTCEICGAMAGFNGPCSPLPPYRFVGAHHIDPGPCDCVTCGITMVEILDGQDRECVPKEPGWYWVRESQFHDWRPACWREEFHDWEMWGSIETLRPSHVACVGPRIEPPPWLNHPLMNRERVTSIDSPA